MAVLSGLKVVEMPGGIASAVCGLHLVDAGADVVRIEPPTGDNMRTYGPEVDGESAVWRALNMGKRSATIDLDDAKVEAAVERMFAGADVVIQEVAAGVSPPWDRDRLDSINPRLVRCLVSAYGSDGPDSGAPATELEVQGAAGMMWFLGRFGGPPVRMGADVAYVNTGIHAALAVMAALLEREESGLGQDVEVSMAGSLLSLGSTWMVDVANPDQYTGGATAPYDPQAFGYRGKDRQLIFGLLGRRGDRVEPWTKLCHALGIEAILEDPWMAEHGSGFVGVGGSADELRPLVEFAVQERKAEDVLELVFEIGGYGAPFMSYEDLFGETPHPQVAASGNAEPLPGTGRIGSIRSPWIGPPDLRLGDLAPSAPAGAHTRAVLRECGLGVDEIDEIVTGVQRPATGETDGR
ncbi:MAG: hypothetical protein GEU28_07970 [Dehalococcoidia bacterium]|nr:hypothetical protein [Dehalococcoidia bacterium]